MILGVLFIIAVIIASCNFFGEKKDPVSPHEIYIFDLSPFDSAVIISIDSLDIFTDNNLRGSGGNAWWWYVNQAIWNRAHQDIGDDVGLDCKPWASNVVKDATGFALPSTGSPDFYLNSGHVIMIVDGNTPGGGTIEYGISVGNIIQMHIKSSNYDGPHTAIFYRYVDAGMYWIDSNWYQKAYPHYVYVHYVSFDWFRSKVDTRYSIYQAQNY